MVVWNLQQIMTKTRQLTGTPSQDQMSDAILTDYINTFYVFTMPFELKEQINLQPFNFTTVANQDVYPVSAAFQTNEPMAYANGFPLVFYQDRDVFYQDWPQQYTQDQVDTGDGTVGPYTGTTQASPVIVGTYFITDGTQVLSDAGTPITNEDISTGTGGVAYNGILAHFPIEPGSLQITDSVETFSDNGLGVLNGSLGGTGTIVYATGVWTATFNSAVTAGQDILADYGFPPGSGILSGDGSGTINYVTGAFSATFNTAVTTGTLIYDNYQAYQPARPQGVLFYNNEFTFRPIPNQVYQITMQGFITQIALDAQSNPNQLPLQTEWGQLIAYGAALDIFADRSDIGAYNNFFPIFKRYENVALGRFVENYENAQSVPRF